MSCEMCRICERISDLYDLFDPEYANLLEKLITCADISIDADDELPKKICFTCRENLESAYDFKILCECTDKKLRNLVRFEKVEIDYGSRDDDGVDQTELIIEEDCHIDKYGDVGLLTEEPVFDSDNSVLQYEDIESIETYLAPLGCDQNVANCSIELITDVDYVVDTATEGESTDCNMDMGTKCLSERDMRGTSNKSLQCDTCGSSFTIFAELNQHKKTHGDNRYQCHICLKWFSKRYRLKNHMITHGNSRTFSCTLCDNKYTHSGNLDRHIRHFHKKERPYMCTVCGLSFSRSNILKLHHTVHISERNYECEICNKRFKAPYYLKVHKKSHLPAESRTKQKVKSNKITMKIPVICSYCGKKSSSRAVHLSHVRTHTGEKPFECKICKKRFAFRQSLKSHELLHTGEKPYKCEFCYLSFRQIGHLKGHMLIHSGVKNFKCEYCDKAFALKSNLVVHQRLHTGETPFHCGLCTRKFHDSNSLKRHKLNHLQKSTEMPLATKNGLVSLEPSTTYLSREGNKYNEIVEIQDGEEVKIINYNIIASKYF